MGHGVIYDIVQKLGEGDGERGRRRGFHIPWLLLDNVMTFVPTLGHRMVFAARPKQ